jgi:glutathione S-transferase
MKLYHSQFTRSGRARWILEEINTPYDITRISFRAGEHKTPEYLAIHPHGSVPALVDGDLKLWESSAIVMHLADKFPDAHLAPALGTDARAQYYRWIVYVPATVDPVLETLTMHTRFLPEEKRNPALVADAMRRLGNIATVLETALDGTAFIVGDSFTAADIVVGSAIGWIGFLGLLGDHPKLAAYLEGMSKRPAYQRANAD